MFWFENYIDLILYALCPRTSFAFPSSRPWSPCRSAIIYEGAVFYHICVTYLSFTILCFIISVSKLQALHFFYISFLSLEWVNISWVLGRDTNMTHLMANSWDLVDNRLYSAKQVDGHTKKLESAFIWRRFRQVGFIDFFLCLP